MLSQEGQLLTQSGDVFRQWREHFEELLNQVNTSSWHGGLIADSFISLAEVTEVAKKLPSGNAQVLDEIQPEMLKALNTVGLSWLTYLCSVAWRSGTVPAEYRTGVVAPLFLKRGVEGVLQL